MADSKKKMSSSLKIPVVSENQRTPSIIRHLKIFKLFGGTFQVVEIGEFSKVCVFSVCYVTLIACLNIAFSIKDMANLQFNGQVNPMLYLFVRVLNILGKPSTLIVMFLKRFDSAKAIEKLSAVQKVLGLTQYKFFISIKIMTILLIIATVPVVYVVGFEFELIFLIAGAVFVASISSHLFHFTYLISCVSACFDELSRTGIVVVDDFSVKRYVQIFSHLIEVSSTLNGYFEFAASLTFLMAAVDFVNAASRFWAPAEVTPVELYMGLTPAILAHIGIFHIVMVCQSATDKVSARNLNYFSVSI